MSEPYPNTQRIGVAAAHLSKVPPLMSDAVPSQDPIHEPTEARKPRSRFWLYLPFVLIAVATLGYGGFWFVASQRLAAGVETQAAALREAGYDVALSGGKVRGFPFRLKLTYAEARIGSPSGWAVAAPGLEAEAMLHNLGHWVVVAPEGMTVTRPQGGPIAVRGVLRGSLNGLSKAPWRIVLQASKASFTPAPGAKPFSLASAELVEFYLKPSAKPDEGLMLFRIQGGKGRPGSLGGQIAGDGTIGADLNGRITHVGAFRGADWGEAVRAWTRAGGVVDQIQGQATVGAFSAKAGGGTLGVGSDKRLVGAVPLELRQAGKALSVLADANALAADAAGSAAAVAAARAQGEAATVNLVFQAGVATFGPVRVGPSPTVG